ncbi:MAG: peptidoglycan editing factor PgeF [Pseudomonadota bacterium]|mgnify:FL=1|nr:peptidoglycan editing factor PgeF [Pseudomonadota bacterium]MEC8693574.1 peptidoglycan editing factor PgeF [Pseudomonadota bacterium]MEC9077131.1 peptidoglycan editing factor PgeF [Pseudomonadota bacterium]
MSDPWLEIDCGPNVLALQTICHPEPGPYGSFNLGLHVGDGVASVVTNRARLAQRFGREVYFPEQVHGIEVVCVDQESPVITADAAVTDQLHYPIGIITADCLPVLFASQDLIGAAHAGWRGLVSGVLERTLQEFPDPAKVRVWLGPCIGRDAFEVGPEVVDAFVSKNADWGRFFKSVSDSDRSMADLQGIACDVLENLSVVTIQRFDACTYSDSKRWYSYRRSGVTGRMASCIMRTE